ncbi:MAG: hypothetical protein HYZ29_35985 [Myxococcales bacterium]|nr:hypothetical protein [Myxococcales bacterium]
MGDRREQARRAVWAAALASGATVAQLVGAKAARDALFLSHHDLARLPEMMAAAAGLSLVAALGAARAMAAWGPARVLPVALIGNAALFSLQWALVTRAPASAGLALYLQVALLGATLTAGTWALINECFDPHTAKRVVGRIAMGGTAGGAIGGLIGYALGRAGGISVMLLVLAALNLAAIAPVRLLGGRARRQPPADRVRTRSGFDVIHAHPYLGKLGIMVVLVAITSALLDFVMSARVIARIPKGPELMAFFALFHMGVGLSSFAVQALGTRAALGRLGLAGTMAALPLGVMGASALMLGIPHLITAVVARGTDALVQTSLYRAAYEVAYTPVPRGQKRPAKMLIDVGFDRIGTALGSGIVLQILPRVADAERVLLVVAVATAVASLITILQLHRGYVAALADSLRRGAVRLDAKDALDATTRRTLAETAALDRKKILASIERLRPGSTPPSTPPPPVDPGGDTLADLPPDGREEGFGSAPFSMRFAQPDEPSPAQLALADLRSGDAARARARLTGDERFDPDLVAAVIGLLGNDDLSRDALRCLRGWGDLALPELCCALADHDLDAVIRRRIPRVLESLEDPRAAKGLLDALFADEIEVRRQAAFALQRQPSPPPRERVLAAVELELRRGAAGSAAAEGAGDPAASVEQAVVLLSLVLEREPLSLAYRALRSGDDVQRGTALEYFENVLPEALRSHALPLLARLGPRDGPRRDAATLRAKLLETRS